MQYEYRADITGTQQVPCQSCGDPVTVPSSFVGCAFCTECRDTESYTATSEAFMPPSIKFETH